MKRYNPELGLESAAWLELDEGERIELVEKYHRGARDRCPNPMLHAVIHVVVENQLAEGVPAVVEAMERLTKEGLKRHDALHAIASVLSEHMFEIMQAPSKPRVSTGQARFEKDLAKLSARSWRAS